MSLSSFRKAQLTYPSIVQAWRGPLIYCSQATLQLLQQKWPEVAAEALELEQAHSIALPQPGGTSLELSVTLLDADHCPVSSSPLAWLVTAVH